MLLETAVSQHSQQPALLDTPKYLGLFATKTTASKYGLAQPQAWDAGNMRQRRRSCRTEITE